jgi:hypothetical protein
MMGKSVVVLEKTLLLESLTNQHTKIKIVTYLCLMKEYHIIQCMKTSALLHCITSTYTGSFQKDAPVFQD